MVTLKFRLKSFQKPVKSPQTYSLSKLPQPNSQNNIVTRKQFQRQRKSHRIRQSTTEDKKKQIHSIANRQVKVKKSSKHDIIYSYQLKNLQKLDIKIQQQLNSVSQRQRQKEILNTEEGIIKQMHIELNNFTRLNMFCRSFELFQQENQHSDLTLIKFLKKRRS